MTTSGSVEDYTTILNHPEYVARRAELMDDPDIEIRDERAVLVVTELGRQFARVCTGRVDPESED